MPGAFFGPFLSDDARRELARELQSILPGLPEQQKKFLKLAEREIGFYRELTIPLKRSLDLLPDKLKRVAEAGNAFAAAIAGLDSNSKTILHQHLTVEMSDESILDFENVVAAAEWARLSAKAANGYLESLSGGPPGPSPGGDRAVVSLVKCIAGHYAKIFRKRPSASRGAIFERALTQILDTCDVRDPEDETRPLKIGETRLRSILQAQAPIATTRVREIFP